MCRLNLQGLPQDAPLSKAGRRREHQRDKLWHLVRRGRDELQDGARAALGRRRTGIRADTALVLCMLARRAQ
jgi:hypothetical protein